MLCKEFVLRAVPDAQVLYDANIAEPSVAIDSRKTQQGDFFVAMQGAHHDGHTYITQVLALGVAGILMNRSRRAILDTIAPQQLQGKLIVMVEDSIAALGNIAALWRSQFEYPVIGVTGSVGKTSTREMIVHILEAAGISYVSTSSNQNGLIGVPLNLLRMRSHHQVAIIEMGISRRGEMARLANMVRPTSAVITTVGHSHMEGLGSLADIAHEKRDIFKYFSEHNIGVVQGDQPLLGGIGYAHPVIRFGAKTTNQVQARKIRVDNERIDFILKMYNQKFPVRLATNHEGMVYNALAAACVGCLLQIPYEKIIQGIQVPLSITGRHHHLTLPQGKGVLINDCYNANPESMRTAIMALEGYKTDSRKIVVLSDMLELGIETQFWHRQLGRFLRKAPSISQVVLVGTHVAHAIPMIPAGMQVTHVATVAEAIEAVRSLMTEPVVMLVKGSRSTGLAVLVDTLVQPSQSFVGATRVMQQEPASQELQVALSL